MRSIACAERHPYLTVATISGLFGAIAFVYIYGVQVLDGTYVDWIRNATGDFTQSYYGWRFYRASAWHFPPGLMDSVAYPSLTSIIYIDSVPLFNFIFKVLSPLLPETFQFFGIWGLTCFVLNTSLGSCCVYRLTGRQVYAIVTAPLFALCPFAIQRLYTHTALAANWVILAAMLLAMCQAHQGHGPRQALSWAAVFALAVGVNIYYLPIVGVVMVSYTIYRCARERGAWPLASVFTVSLAGTFVAFWFFGGLYHLSGAAGSTDTVYGYLSANLLSLINPMQTNAYLTGWSVLLPSHGLATPGQYEGYAYLGAGLIALIALAVAMALVRARSVLAWLRRHALGAGLVLGSALVLAVLSWGTLVSVGRHEVLEIPYPSLVLKFFSVFRSSGRFMWGVWDIVAIASLAALPRLAAARSEAAPDSDGAPAPRVGLPPAAARVATVAPVLLVLVCLPVQGYDLKEFVQDRQALFLERQEAYEPLVSVDGVRGLLAGKSHLVLMEEGSSILNQEFYDLGEAVLQSGATINDFYYSRRDSTAIEEAKRHYRDELDSGAPRADTLYVFTTFADAARYQDSLHLYYLNGFVFGRTDVAEGFDELGPIREVASAEVPAGEGDDLAATDADAAFGAVRSVGLAQLLGEGATTGTGLGVEVEGDAANGAMLTSRSIANDGKGGRGGALTLLHNSSSWLMTGTIPSGELASARLALGTGVAYVHVYELGAG